MCKLKKTRSGITCKAGMCLLFASQVLFSTVDASEVKRANINGAMTTFVEEGSGPLLILAHGSVSDYKRWLKDHVPLFSEDYRVVSYSMRYHGDEVWDEAWPPLTMDLYADDLAGLIQYFDTGPAHLVGWSMGATVAHTTALKYPELVRSAYLFEGAAAMNKSPADHAQDQALRDSFFSKTNSLLSKRRYHDAAGALINSVVGEEGFFESLPQPVQTAIGNKGKVLAAVFEEMKDPSMKYDCETISNSRVPTLLVVGEETAEYFSTSLAERYSPCLGSGRVLRVPEANHVWPGKASEFFSSVHEFTSKH